MFARTDEVEPNFLTIHLHQWRNYAADWSAQQQRDIFSLEQCSVVAVLDAGAQIRFVNWGASKLVAFPLYRPPTAIVLALIRTQLVSLCWLAIGLQ